MTPEDREATIRRNHTAPESWPGLAEHMRAAFLAEQAAAREALRDEDARLARQRPEAQSVASGFTQHHYYGFRRTA